MSSSAAAKPTPEQVKDATAALAQLLANSKHAIVGGAAILFLGSSRGTEDVDVVVPQGQTKAARDLIKTYGQGKFSVDPRTLHTYYLSTPPVEIEILTPPGLFKGTFNQNTQTMAITHNNTTVQILHPAAILDAKCGAIGGRATEAKKQTDAQDIIHLLMWLKSQNMSLFADNVPNASVEWVQWFVSIYGFGNYDYWKNVGWTESGASFLSKN